MILFDFVYSIIREIEREKGNFGEQDKIVDKVNFIFKNSSMIYDNEGLYITGSSKLGIEHWKDTELELPKYLIFIIDSSYKKWELKTVNNIEDIEYELNYLEEFEFAVIIVDGVVKEYTLVEDTINSRVIWKDPIFQIEYTIGQENKEILIYERLKLQEEVIRLVKDEDIKDIQVFNIIEGCYEHFYISGVIYSTSGGERPLQFIWGKSDITFIDLAEDENIW